MLQEEIKRLEDLFRQCQIQPVLPFVLKGLQSEVEAWMREYPHEPRLVVLHEEIKIALKQALDNDIERALEQ